MSSQQQAKQHTTAKEVVLPMVLMALAVVALVALVASVWVRSARQSRCANNTQPPATTQASSSGGGGGTVLVPPSALGPLDGVVCTEAEIQDSLTVDDYGGLTLVTMFVNGMPTAARIDTTFAGVYIPGLAAGSALQLQLPLTRMDTCTGWTDSATTGPAQPLRLLQLGDVFTSPYTYLAPYAVLGLGPGPPVRASASAATLVTSYGSPVLEALARAGRPLAWSIGQDGVRAFMQFTWSPCQDWCLSRMQVTDAAYFVPLQPHAAAPWTRLVLKLGRWGTELPGAPADTSAALQLVTAGATCVITVESNAYHGDVLQVTERIVPDSTTGALGLKACGIAGMDLGRKLFGYVARPLPTIPPPPLLLPPVVAPSPANTGAGTGQQ